MLDLPLGGVAGGTPTGETPERSLAWDGPNREATPAADWKPMSAEKMRAAARQDQIAKINVDREAFAMSKATANATKWRDAFDDDQALPIDEAADC